MPRRTGARSGSASPAGSRVPPGPEKKKPQGANQPSIFGEAVVYAPVALGVGVLLIGMVYDPHRAFEQVFPPPIKLSRALNMMLSPIVWSLWAFIILGITLERKATATYGLDRRERFAMIWALMNLCWFHTGADVLSGLFGIMPNLSEDYLILNKDHKLPMHHPERVVMDCIYWFELLVEAPLALVVFYLFYTQDKARYVVESWLHGMHLGGYVGYYIPDMVLGETTHPVISNLDRCIAFTWVWVPAVLVWDAIGKARRG